MPVEMEKTTPEEMAFHFTDAAMNLASAISDPAKMIFWTALLVLNPCKTTDETCLVWNEGGISRA